MTESTSACQDDSGDSLFTPGGGSGWRGHQPVFLLARNLTIILKIAIIENNLKLVSELLVQWENICQFTDRAKGKTLRIKHSEINSFARMIYYTHQTRLRWIQSI